MVYCGMPSRGCDMCRVRKIKCDQARPACSQCWTTTRSCPGYRDQATLIFRNETSTVIQKARGVSHERSTDSQRHTLALDQSRLGTNESVHRNQWPSIHPSPVSAAAGDRIFQATCFFLSHYPGLAISRLAKDHLSQRILSDTSLGERALKASIASVGLANLGNLYSSSEFLNSSKRAYILALNQINTALGDPTQATQDTTLAAILCLSLYEIIIFERSQSHHAWLTHIKGATALLELRGKDQFRRQAGLRLFHMARNEVLLGCLQSGQRVPEKLTTLPGYIVSEIRTDPLSGYNNNLIGITASLCNLQAAIKNGNLQESMEVLSIAEAIDSQLLGFASEFFKRFPYKVQKGSGSVSSIWHEGAHISNYDGSFHIYTSGEACNVWNTYRCARITVNRLIFKYVHCLERQTQRLVDNDIFKKKLYSCESLLRQLAIETCLSVPFKLGLAGKGSESSTRPKMIDPASGFALLFPLYLAATVDGYPGSVCVWVITCFNVFWRSMGINAALALLETLPRTPGLMN